ncbi:glycerol-3-phosphate dehydrogenase [Massilia sp. PAMC28688]|uniref:glycerol-3-phosphate dehydrogenase n=1 Tax=Massilia sp. PAMC28688 TaxID=2861283 RepID=UPI001C638890|nr:glycerol-3-phosphate dehydrogenase [Massilia sp. PAMC28688]QYF92809.1 glycerol-3-phosphate dehydrogenase [Massilia sp. PAMC28688]
MNRIDCDVLVVGGGINGAGIARDAAGRGLSVVLCEKDDLASHTSSASSKLIHGGLRYLEHYQFALVRKALAEREVLLRSAPHIMRPLRFVMPHDRGQRPAWMIRAGLFLYDSLARREFLPGSHAASLRSHPAGRDLKPAFTRAFVYSDGWVDDARLVVLNAIDARERGATIFTRTACTGVERGPVSWQATLAHAGAGQTAVTARCLVNAAGPWAARFLGNALPAAPHAAQRLIKGSHIVVPRLFEHPYAYIFQHPDGRIVFAIPYEGAFTLVGTTDLDYTGDLDQVAISTEEVAYLCQLANRYFARPIAPADVVWSYSGVRPLVHDPAASAAAATRDYRLALDTGGAPLLSVFGGKITTYRKLAEQALARIAPLLDNAAPAWTAHACLPGGDLFGERPTKRGILEFEAWAQQLAWSWPWLPAALAARFARAYGTRTACLLAGCAGMGDLGRQIVPGLYEAEARYLMKHEWARTGADILWRRTKLGLHAGAGSEAQLDAWISALPPA